MARYLCYPQLKWKGGNWGEFTCRINSKTITLETFLLHFDRGKLLSWSFEIIYEIIHVGWVRHLIVYKQETRFAKFFKTEFFQIQILDF